MNRSKYGSKILIFRSFHKGKNSIYVIINTSKYKSIKIEKSIKIKYLNPLVNYYNYYIIV